MAVDGGRDMATAHYTQAATHLVLTHTRVPERLAGLGVGSTLARGVLEALRASGRQAVLRCPFMAAYRSLHPEFADVVNPFNSTREKT